MNERRNIEDIYPLTAMQQGMLFHSLYASESGVYVQQVSARLAGTLDPARVRRTWQALVDRHPMLRTAFEWERRADPFQVVYRQVVLPWTDLDWSQDAEERQTELLAAFLAADRARGFALRSAPLMRVMLARLGPAAWQLVWTHHHVVLDGWSVPLLLHDFFTAYDAIGAGRDPMLPPRRPFRDHLAWLKTRSAADAERFWTGELRGVDTPPPLPARRADRGERSFRGAPAHASIRLSAEESTRVAEFARASHLTLSTVLQGAWALVLSRHTGVPRALYGTTVSGRPAELPGSDAMIGLFINTLPVRVEVPPDARAIDWLRALQDRIARQRAFEQTPLVDILGWSGLGRDSNPLETLFVFENYPVDASLDTRLPGVRIEQADALEQTNFPITFVAAPGDRLLLKVDYDSGRYERATIDRLLDGVRRALRAFQAEAARPLGSIQVSAEVQLSRGPAVARGPLVHEMIDAQARATPEAPAVVDGDATLSFAELRERSDAVAADLRARGVGLDDRVGVALPPSAGLVVTLLGILKAGAAYVPIDPAHPVERRRFIAGESGVRLVLDGGQTPSTDRLNRLSRRVAGSDPRSLAYVLYTSGSTGMPKGVMVTHEGLANYVRWAIDAYGAAGGNGAPLHSPLGFDLTVTSLFPPLAAGRPVHIVPPGSTLDQLTRTLAGAPSFSLVKITPAHLDALRDLLPASEAAAATRAFVIGGEALTQEQLRHWRTHAPGTRLFNEYGPTETVVGCAIYDATADAEASGPVAIGVPIANTSLYVLDAALLPVPDGVTGELYIAGAGVARGYQQRPDLTAERFLPDPFAGEPGARMYRSGDLARRRADGVLEFLGRTDDQVKVRGYRIEPGEVEAALAAHPAVTAAAVVATGTGGDVRLAAFVTPATVPTIDVREFLRPRLPEYMVPATVTALDALPQTVNGKIDRRALLALGDEGAASPVQTSPPRGAVEELLAAIWADILGIARIGRDDNFFALGGHSLLATRLVARIRQAFGAELPLKAIFEAPTVAALAARLDAPRDAETARRIAPRPPDAPLVLSVAQRRLWFLHELDRSSPAYLVPAALSIDGALDADALRSALQQVVDRHDVLRTRIVPVDGMPAVTIADDAVVALPVVDVTAPGADAQRAEVERLAAEEARTPFDLAAPPLLRGRLLRRGPDRHVLLLTLHHIASDAWSMELLVREVAALYEARRARTAAALPPLPLQYADVAAWDQSQPDRATAVEYWTTRLAHVPPLVLPYDAPRPAVPTLAGASLTIELPPAATTLVRAARADNATPFVAFLAAFEVLLARYGGAEDFAVGTPVANREQPEVAGLIGFFMNTLALRSDVGGNPTFTELRRRVRRTLLDAHAHGDLPFERVLDAVQPARELGHHPVFQAMFTLQHAPSPIELPGLRIAPLPSATVTSKFDVTLSVTETAGGWTATFEYSTELFEAATIARMATHYARLVEAAAADPSRPALALEFLDDEERSRAILRGGENGGALAPVHVAIAAQAARTPDAVALVCGEEQVSYGELERRANALAAELAATGVQPGFVVDVALERSVAQIVRMLAILKAGAAYLPIDPAHPPARIEAMRADAGIGGQTPSAGRLNPLSRPVAGSDPSSLAYVLFTSGSTGRPKGVLIPHEALAGHMAWMQRAFPLAPGDRVLQKTPATFDASVWEFWAPLMAGATLVLARPDGHQDPDYLVGEIRRQRITILQAVPSLLRLIADVPGFRECRSLRRIFAGGEALTADLRDRLFAATDADVVNLYGPTEVTIDAVAWRCDRGDTSATVPIGLPVDHTRAYVLDARLSPVPPGVAGELFLAGRQLARGYARQPALTAERFLPDPFAGEPGARMYRTGDRVRRLPSGALAYLGRLDDQIKVRGMRVEPAEIERAIEQHAAVSQALVELRVDGPTRRLIAFVVPRAGATLDADALRDHARAALPDHMVPAAFVTLADLPRLPSGKVDRRRLPAPPREVDAGGTAPRTDREARLARIWAEVLGLPQVGVHDNFFTLGGDSILSLQVVARARGAGLRITPAQMFLHQTVEALAQAATDIGAAPAPAEAPSGVVPLTPIQQWFFDRALPDPHHWNQALLLETPADVDARHLEAALRDVTGRHDAFRLRFDGEAQSYADEAPARLDVIALHDDPELLAAHLDHVQASIDLAQAPLLRAAWFDLGPDRPGRLLLAAHHLVIDGVSWRVLLEDLQTAYEARRAGRVPAFAAATASFQAWSRRLAFEAAHPDTAAERDFWMAQLAPAPRLHRDRADPVDLEADARHVDVWLAAEPTAQLLRQAQDALGARPSDLMLAALVDGLAPWSGGRLLLVDLEAHGRDVLDLDVSRTVGWFTTLYPVRLDASATRGPAALLAAVTARLRAVPRKGIGFGLLRAATGAALPGTRPDIAFNYHGRFPGTDEPRGGFRPAAEPPGTLRSPRAPRTHALEVVAGVVDGRLQVRWTYGTRQYNPDTVASMADACLRSLQALIEHGRDTGAGPTPSDFTASGLDQRELDKLLSRLRGV